MYKINVSHLVIYTKRHIISEREYNRGNLVEDLHSESLIHFVLQPYYSNEKAVR